MLQPTLVHRRSRVPFIFLSREALMHRTPASRVKMPLLVNRRLILMAVAMVAGSIARPLALAQSPALADQSSLLFAIFSSEQDAPKTPAPQDSHGHHQCGLSRADELAMKDESADQIVGGVPMFGQYPWTISIRELRNGRTGYHFCSASLINSHWAITTAFCLTSDHGISHKLIVLRLGEYDSARNNESYTHKDMKVDKIVIHPGYDVTESFTAHDLALIKFAKPVKFKKYISPVCIPSAQAEEKEANLVGRIGQFVGWGDTLQATPDCIPPKVLRHFSLPIISNEKCKELTDTEHPDTELCAGQSLDRTSTPKVGFGGGPLTITDNDGRATLAGVFSHNYACRSAPCKPLVFIRVSEYLPWIHNVTTEV